VGTPIVLVPTLLLEKKIIWEWTKNSTSLRLGRPSRMLSKLKEFHAPK